MISAQVTSGPFISHSGCNIYDVLEVSLDTSIFLFQFCLRISACFHLFKNTGNFNSISNALRSIYRFWHTKQILCACACALNRRIELYFFCQLKHNLFFFNINTKVHTTLPIILRKPLQYWGTNRSQYSRSKLPILDHVRNIPGEKGH